MTIAPSILYTYRCECGYFRSITVANTGIRPSRVDCVSCGEPMASDWHETYRGLHVQVAPPVDPQTSPPTQTR